MAKPLYKMTDAELDAIANDENDPRSEKALNEMHERGHERVYGEAPEDTPCLPEPWWVDR